MQNLKTQNFNSNKKGKTRNVSNLQTIYNRSSSTVHSVPRSNVAIRFQQISEQLHQQQLLLRNNNNSSNNCSSNNCNAVDNLDEDEEFPYFPSIDTYTTDPNTHPSNNWFSVEENALDDEKEDDQEELQILLDNMKREEEDNQESDIDEPFNVPRVSTRFKIEDLIEEHIYFFSKKLPNDDGDKTICENGVMTKTQFSERLKQILQENKTTLTAENKFLNLITAAT